MSVVETLSKRVGDTDVQVTRGGSGRPLLVLHDELGFSGWNTWTASLASTHQVIVPHQPGFGSTDRVDWVADYRDLAAFYLRLVRELDLGTMDLMGFSAGAYLAAEMIAACPDLFGSAVLVAPLGLRPTEGEIFDFLAVTARTHLATTISCHDAPDVAVMYGGEMSPEQFERFEAARAETSRLGWEPFMFSESLGHRLRGIRALRTLVIWGSHDRITPRGCVTAYEQVLEDVSVTVLPGCGHRPEVEDPAAFVEAVEAFLALSLPRA